MLHEWDITIIDNLTYIEDIFKQAKQMKKKDNYDIIYIDHLHHIESRKTKEEYYLLDLAVKGGKKLAKEIKTPIIYLAQLKKDGKEDRPIGTDIKGNGNISHIADMTFLLHTVNKEIDGNYYNRLLEFIVEKNRNGKIGVEKYIFETDCRRFIPDKKYYINKHD
jgi:replicative DNA helicase